MQRALELAKRARGRTSPNPLVGAVLVKDGTVVGEGYHHNAGGAHAEINALRDAGDRARGATLYVTLEPCCHYGRTPPCTHALIEAGINEVHMAMLDPNPRVAGQGRDELEHAGIRTVVGEEAQAARVLNETYIHWIQTDRPFVLAKFAMSLDGKIATHTGDARWISAPASRRYTHHLRDELDAILVGVDTVIADDPRLTTRLEKDDVRHPLRVVLDSCGRTPLDATLLNSAQPGRTLIATTDAMPTETRRSLEGGSTEVIVVPTDTDGRVDLPALLDHLGAREITSVLVEGGSTVLGSFFRLRLVDKVVAFVAPMIIGGAAAPTPVGGAGADRIADASQLSDLSIQRLETDLLVTGYPEDTGEDADV